MRTIIVTLLVLASSAFASKGPKVVLIVIDGVRNLEIDGKAKDDSGKTVAADAIFPNLMELRRKGVFFPEMHVDNPVGISLPAYADIFAGRRQEKITSNEPGPSDFHSHFPTIFQAVRHWLGDGKRGNEVAAIHSSWEPLCRIAVTPDGGGDNDFHQDCGWQKRRELKPEVYKDSRVDMDTFVRLAAELPKRHPRFAFVHFGDADEEAHLHNGILAARKVHYGIFNYHKALREADYYVGRIWKLLQEDAYYKDNTYLIVTTDHGRDNYADPLQWSTHGDCVAHGKPLCSGCKHIFAIAVGPGLKARTVSKSYGHVDLAPTVARLLGVPFPSASGEAITEIAPKKELMPDTLHAATPAD